MQPIVESTTAMRSGAEATRGGLWARVISDGLHGGEFDPPKHTRASK